ncbi:MAG: DUF4249 domain-containing protein [Bacteroidota bacterium]
MRSFFLYLLFLPILFTIAACDEDSFSQVVNIPIPEHEPLPVLSLNLQTGDTLAKALLGVSRGILDEFDENDNRGAKLELYQDDVLIGMGSYGVSSGRFWQGMQLSEPITGNAATYRLVGQLEGFEPVEATQAMPTVPVFENVRYTRDGAIDSEGFRVDEVEFDLIDPPGEENFYAFRVSVAEQACIFDPLTGESRCREDTTRLNSLFLTSPDPLLSDGLDFDFVLSDQSFDGTRYRVRLQADNFTEFIPFLEVFHLSEDAYRYMRSFAAYQESRDNPFAEPVQVHNNVVGGYGAFIIANKALRRLEE